MEWLNELAMAGATTLVAAMATQAWDSARESFLKVFPGPDEKGRLARRVDLDARALAELHEAEVERARGDAADAWQVRLRDLLEENPEAAEALRTWADRVREELPASPQTRIQVNSPRGRATVFATQEGTQIITGGPGAGRST